MPEELDRALNRQILHLLSAAVQDEPSAPQNYNDTVLDDATLHDAARRGGVLPLLYRQSRCPSLKDAARGEMQRGLATASELAAVLTSCRERSLRVLPYKGPALSLRLWDDPILRPCRDLDLLVAAEDRAAFAEVLQVRGYRRAAEHDTGHHEGWMREDLGLLVEAHHALVPSTWPLDLAMKELWRGTTECELLGRCIEVMEPEIEMIVLSVHAARHGWCRLLWAVDLARAAQTLDRGALLDRARGLGVERIVRLALESTRQLFSLDGPPDQDAAVAGLAAQVVELFLGGERPRGIAQTRLQLVQRERRRDRLRYLWRLRRRGGGLPSGAGLGLWRSLFSS